MSVIFLLIPLSVIIAAAFLGAFIWAVRSGQFDDTVTPSLRVLMPDSTAPADAEPVSRSAAEPAPDSISTPLKP
jgi:cbb3-type cytochrome oxidase maturation protein